MKKLYQEPAITLLNYALYDVLSESVQFGLDGEDGVHFADFF